MKKIKELSWTTKDELLYLKNIGKTLHLAEQKITQKDVLQGYLKGLEKRVKWHGDKLSIDKKLCRVHAHLMLAETGENTKTTYRQSQN